MKAKISRTQPMVNMANSAAYGTGNPRMVHTKEGCVIRHVEGMGALPISSTLDLAGRVDLNPADSVIFPWLSTISRSYSLYRWRKVKVMFVSRQPTTATGLVALGDFYDEQDISGYFAAPTALKLINTNSGMIGAVWSSTLERKKDGFGATIEMTFDCTGRMSRTQWCVVDQNVNHTNIERSNQQNSGFFGYFISQSNSNGSSGELLCEYEIELLNPKTASLDIPHTVSALADKEGEGSGAHRWKWLKPIPPAVPDKPTEV